MAQRLATRGSAQGGSMDKHLIFFVHGIGDQAKGWSKDLRSDFKALFDSFPLPPGGRPFAEQFQTEEILYNDLFDEWRKRVARDADGALKMFGAGGLGSGDIGELLKAGAAAGGGGFFRTHALDVLQYRFLRLVADAVRDAVEHQIMSRLSETDFGTPVRWSVIAHSMGTSVMHDTLHDMFRPGAGAEGSALFQPHAVLMLANVSQLLHDEGFLGNGVDAYRTVVKPDRESASGACRYYLSSTNGFDPVAVAGDFKPPESWLSDSAKLQRRFRVLDFKSIPKNAQVHGFGEYLAHPAVHVPLFRILTGDQDWISDAEENAAHQRYNAANPPLDANHVKRQAIDALVQRAGASGWFERIALWKEVLDAFAG
jgi:hypothetical protein